MTTQSFIDISPSKEKKVCENCKHFSKWGVHTGTCYNRKKATTKGDYQTCKKFEKK